MIVASGAGCIVMGEAPDAAECEVLPYLRTRKSRKYMGLQDELAVVAAGRALASAGLARAPLGDRAGLYLAVGYIPFEAADIDPVLAASLDDGRFSMARFGGGGFQQAHPLLTFRCLPNMPAYHVSVNFDVQGPYLVTYPGPGQTCLALDEARAALEAGDVDVALVGGVAHQRNFLVEHHFGRLEPPTPSEHLRDAAAFLVLERDDGARGRGHAPLGCLESLSIAYTPFDPFEAWPASAESFSCGPASEGALGPASLPAALARAWARGERSVRHEVSSRDGIRARSTWS